MEDLFEILIPLVIAGVYFFGNMLSKKSGDEFEEGLPMPRTREPEETEQQRQVREEIRRKIEDRKREAPATPATPGFPTPPPLTAPPEPARTVRERTKQTNERVHETRVPQTRHRYRCLNRSVASRILLGMPRTIFTKIPWRRNWRTSRQRGKGQRR